MKRNLTYSILTALLWVFSFPPFRTGFLAYFALIPLFMLLQDKSGREAWRWGYITGLFIAIGTLYWIGWVTMVGMLGTLICWPIYIAVYAVLHTFLLRRWSRLACFFLPFVWVAIEYSQAYSDLAFPWNYLGYSQSYYLPLIQFAEYFAVYGVGFWVFVINVLWWQIMVRRQNQQHYRALVLIVAVLFLLPLGHGLSVLRRERPVKRELQVALVQGNIDPFEKWQTGIGERNFQTYERLTRQAAIQHPELIVWPETAVPFYLRAERDYLRRLHHLADSLHTPIITGAIDYQYLDAEHYDYFNAAFLIEPFVDGFQNYRKMKLVPFSERVPFRDFFVFAALKNLLMDWALGVGDYARGNQHTVFAFSVKNADKTHPSGNGKDTIRCSVPICFESAFPQVNREFVARGAEMLMIITNDAWFGKTSGPHQHARFAVFRAIENRVPIARCANTGISCFVDAYGRVYQPTHWFEEAVRIGKVRIYQGSSFYVRYGNLFAIAATAVACLVVLVSLFLKKRN